MEVTHRTILQFVVACFISVSTAKVISGDKSIRTRSGAPCASCSMRQATAPHVGKTMQPEQSVVPFQLIQRGGVR